MSNDLADKLQHLGATPEALTRLTALFEAPQVMPPGAQLVRQGEIAPCIHLVLSGWAARSRSCSQGARATLGFALPGDVCDLDSLVLGRRTSDVVVLARAQVRRLSASRLRALLREEASLAAAFQHLLALENLVTAEWLVGLARRSALERIAHLICELAVRTGAPPGDGAMRMDWPLTQTELADAAGLSVVHVNRSLQALKRDAGVTADRRQIVVRDWRKLVELAAFDAGYLAVDARAASPCGRDPTLLREAV